MIQNIDAQGLRSRLRARMLQSGMSPEQVRQRLGAMGYDPRLLDPYLDESVAEPAPPSAQLIAALAALEVDPVPLSPRANTEPRRQLPLSDREERLGLRVFGREVFARNTGEFQPVTSGPVGGSYVLGPGDELVLVITGDVEYSYTLPVTREGFVVIPQVGQVWVNGLTINALREQLYAHLGRVYSGVRRDGNGTTRFDVSLGRLRTNQVFVTGEVVAPGSYVVSPMSSLLNALYQAGGPTPNGSFRRVEVVRSGRTVHSVDLYEYLLAGNNLSEATLEPGDVIFVPVAGIQVALKGEVVRPAIFELKPGETLHHLLLAAGGLTAPASTRRARLTRIVPSDDRLGGVDRTAVDIPLAEIMRNPSTAPALRDGDEVHVFAIRSEIRNTVEVRGAVWQQGSFGHSSGMRAWDLIASAGGLAPDAYTARATITRLNLADSTLSVIPLSLRSDERGNPADNPVLQEFDVVEVYSQAASTQRLPISLLGEVHQPVEAVYKEGMTLRDLIVAAGGLRPTADLKIEVARIATGEHRNDGTLVHTHIVEADSSYFISDQSARYYFGNPSELDRDIGSGDPAAFPLMPYDRIIVRQIPEFELHRTVFIGGEVRRPGMYSLLRKDERLLSLLEGRAGGLTSSAFPDGLRFFRHGVRVNVDLQNASRRPDSEDNIVLQPGDSIFLPEYSPMVFVHGAVTSPGAVLYEPGKGLAYYIEGAGGYAREADEDRVHVRYANGESRTRKSVALFWASSPSPGPGSVVTVPALSPEDRTDVRGLIGDIVQIVAGVATVLLVALNR